jgi:hypothetical protein
MTGTLRPSSVRASHARSRACARAVPQSVQAGRIDALQDPPGRRGRGHRTEQVRLVTQDAQVADRLPAVSQQHRQISQNDSGIMR